MTLEFFERRIGSYFAILGAIWLPIPFVGIFTLLQLILFIALGLGGLKDQLLVSTVYNFSIIFAIISLLLFIIGIYVLIKYKKYKSTGSWVRLLCYLFSTTFHFGTFYLQFLHKLY